MNRLRAEILEEEEPEKELIVEEKPPAGKIPDNFFHFTVSKRSGFYRSRYPNAAVYVFRGFSGDDLYR